MRTAAARFLLYLLHLLKYDWPIGLADRSITGHPDSFNAYQAEMHRTYHFGRVDGHALGIAGESGEICDMIKKAHYHKVPYSLDEMKKELGDLLWYLTAVASDHGFKLSDVAAANVVKLRKRYPSGFKTGGGIR